MKFYVVSGDLREEVEAADYGEAMALALLRHREPIRLGLIITVCCRGFDELHDETVIRNSQSLVDALEGRT